MQDTMSIWSQTAALSPENHLRGNRTAEAVVIGGGLAGVLTAWQLRKRCVEVILLEAETIGSGQTRNTTAKITSQHSIIYQNLIHQVGQEKAMQYARANQQAIEDYAQIIREENIDCDFQRLPAYLYSTRSADLLRREAEAAEQLGIDALFTTDTTLPFPVQGAVKFAHQAQFHPLKFLRAMAKPLEVYEHTPVTQVEGDLIRTPYGTVTAKTIVFATHYPFINIPGYYFLRMHQERSYVIALENAAKMDGMYLSADEGILSFRNYGNLLLFGGGSHRTGENSQGGKYDMLRQKANEFWPGCRETAHWSAQDCITLDQVPYIGRYSSSKDNWYVATGFAKWGMTTSMAASRILADMICGEQNPNAEVFSPQRFHLDASAKSLAADSLQAMKGFTREIFAPPFTHAADLPLGHGGIVDYGGKKVGLFKDNLGEVYAVDTRCPHLGCQLEWNPDEKSWDCPCHGSRFDYRGNLIDNPAQTDLGRKA